MEKKIKVAVSGGGGLIGSRIIEILSPKYEFIPLGRNEGFDVANQSSFSIFDKYDLAYFIHLAAKADVDGCEADKELGEGSDAWKINVNGSENVAAYCNKRGIRLVYISTDFVFDGNKPEGEFYTEEDEPNPINFYAKTKYEGEKAILSSGADSVILRVAYPFRKEFEPKKDFVRAILSRLKDGLPIKAVSDHIMCPTYIDDIAISIDKIIDNKASGVFHAVGSASLSPYAAALMIAEKFNLDKNLITTTTRDQYFQGKAARPFNLYLKNDKIKNLGVNMKSFEQGLEELK